ncbi:MAG: aminopeptidase P family protein [Hyphomicrobiales bacterium]
MFPKETYIQRRQRLKESIQNGLILLQGNEESPMNYMDNTYHFRQDSSFLYFSGLKRAGLNIIIDCESGEELLFGDNYTIDDIVWMGEQITLDEEADKVKLKYAGNTDKLSELLHKSQKKGRTVHYILPYRADNKLKLMKWLSYTEDHIEKEHSELLAKAVISQRIYKSDEEIEEIEKAVNTTVEMHKTAMRITRPGIKESEIASRVLEIACATGGNISFPIIATINGQTLHNHYHGNTLHPGQLFLLDCGAETEMGYAGDLSSTFPVNPVFDPVQREIYEITLKAHESAIDMLQPGVNFRDCHIKACTVMAEGMKDMGFLNCNPEEAVERGIHAMFFQCGLGHMMGLDVHDMENLGEHWVGYNGAERSSTFGLKSLRLARELEAGFVLTIEPGIYFIPTLMQKWKKERKFMKELNYDLLWEFRKFGGIRNEENFLITHSGKRLLGQPKPKTIDDIFELRNL